MNSLQFEKFYPWIYGLVALVVWIYSDQPFYGEIKLSLIGSTLTLAAIFTGFLATAESLLISLRGSQVMSDLAKGGYVDLLVDYLSFAMNSSLATCVWAILGYFVTQDSMLACFGIYPAVWAFLCAITVASFFRVSQVLGKVVRRSSTE